MEGDRSLPSWHDDDLVPLSALEHWSYCQRQCGLIHVEQVFEENRFTQRGRRLHERVDSGVTGTERGVRQLRAIPLWSDRLGLIGKSDLVEWHGETVLPVEFKSGSGLRRRWTHESLQLCGQAICLEEMLGVEIPEGAISSLTDRRRTTVIFTAELREAVELATIAIREMITEQALPPAIDDARCRDCSLNEACVPKIAAQPLRLRRMHLDLFRVSTAAEELLADPAADGERLWNS